MEELKIIFAKAKKKYNKNAAPKIINAAPKKKKKAAKRKKR